MKSIKKSNVILSLFLVMLISLFTNVFVKTVNADSLAVSSNTEDELGDIIEQYGEENIIFEDGIIINKGESVQVVDILPWIVDFEIIQSNNNEILSVDGSIITGNSEGVTFLIVKQSGKYHILQAYVYDESIMPYDLEASELIRSKYVVYVDAGHGGKDPGAVANGIKEKDLNLNIALKVRNKLNNKGVEVAMNRDTDVFVDYKETAKHANSVNPDVFVSIHNNSSTSSSINGIETFYTKDIDVPFGKLVHNSLIKNTGAYNRGFKKDIYYVTNHTKMPAILVEGGFLTNSAEAAKLKQDSYQEKIANAIVDGVMEYLINNVDISQIPAERISGPSRYETAIEVFNKGWESAETVVIVTGENYPDALSATPLAAKHDAPILLSKNASLKYQPELYNAIKNKGVKNAIIIGSEGIIPKVVELDLQEIGVATKRIAGSDRYETSLAIAKEVGLNTGEIIVASGENFPDGLSIASIAAKKQIPILLIKEKYIPGIIKNYISSLNISKTYLLGSVGLIPDEVANQLVNVERLAGKDRYETNENIFNKFKDELSLDHLYIASSLDFPDALATSALAAKTNSFVVLTYPTYAATSLRTIINNSRDTLENVYVIGSKALIPDNTFISAGIDIIK